MNSTTPARRALPLLKLSAIIFLLHFTCIKANASHLSHADFHYEYIGNLTGTANEYRVHLTAYLSSSIPPNTINYSICSSCYAEAQETLYLDTGYIPVQTGTNCINTTGTIQYYAFKYSGTYILPGQCSDFTFSCHLHTRISFDNLADPYPDFVVEAVLNNMLGNNSSPSFTSLAQMEFCVGQNATWRNPYFEPDSDSVHAKLASVLGGTRCNSTQIAYSPGYTSNQPITTTPPQSAQFIGNSAFLNFTTAQIENVVVKLVLEEYRYDSTYLSWQLIGSSVRDVGININQTCDSNNQAINLDFLGNTIYFDSIANLPALNLPCHTSSISLPFQTNVDCLSLAADGSDFRLTTQSGIPVPIVNATATCSSLNLTKEIQIDLASAINTNGTYYLYTKMGNDGNTIINECGYELPEFDTILLKVTDCSGIGLDEDYLKDKIVIPNYFSPNGDGVNDVFTVRIPESFKGRFELNVTNRYGRTVYREANYSNQGWDGNLGNSPLPDGVYFCTLTWYEPGKTWPIVFKNHVTIMR